MPVPRVATPPPRKTTERLPPPRGVSLRPPVDGASFASLRLGRCRPEAGAPRRVRHRVDRRPEFRLAALGDAGWKPALLNHDAQPVVGALEGQAGRGQDVLAGVHEQYPAGRDPGRRLLQFAMGGVTGKRFE